MDDWGEYFARRRVPIIYLHGEFGAGVAAAQELFFGLATSGPPRIVNYDAVLEEAIRCLEGGGTPDEVRAKFRMHPALAAIAAGVPRTREEVYAFIAVIIAVLSLLHQMGASDRRLTDDEILLLRQGMASETPACGLQRGQLPPIDPPPLLPLDQLRP